MSTQGLGLALARNPVVAGAVLVGGAGLVVYLVWGEKLKGWFNPASDQNLAYQGASNLVSAITGTEDSLGGWFYELTHKDVDMGTTYLVGFPDGTRHAIAEASVQNGRFRYSGSLYELRTVAGARTAVLVAPYASGASGTW